jgi:hypothetical protein
MSTHLRFVAFQVVASTPAGEPVYSVADIIEPLSNGRNQSKLLKNARKTAGMRGYVLVGRVGMEWPDFEASARRIAGA